MTAQTKIIEKIHAGVISEVSDVNVELKSNWSQEHGKRISAIANELHESEVGFVIVGVNDAGQLEQNNDEWLTKTEQKLSSHIRQYLSPVHTAQIQGNISPDGRCCIVIKIENPGDITSWNNRTYKRVGTQTEEMAPDERLDLSLRLPGQDYSKRTCHGTGSSALITQFAQKLVKNNNQYLPENIDAITPEEILKRIKSAGKMATRILFGVTSI